MTKSSRKTAGVDAREALILAAERLIAEYGIDGVSLRQINAEAGQRNSSAAHYHFGSRDALIGSIYAYRLDSVNRRRRALLEAVIADGRERDVRSIVETFIRPIVDEIHGSAGGSAYIRFLSQVIGHPQADARRFSGSLVTEAAMAAYELLKTALPDIPTELLGQRLGLTWELIIHALADRERFSHNRANGTDPDREPFVENLIDVVTGGLVAPVSAATARAQARRRTG